MSLTTTPATVPTPTAPVATRTTPPQKAPPQTPAPRPTRAPTPPVLTTTQVATALANAPSANVTVTAGSLRATLTYAGTRSAGHVDVLGGSVDFVVVGTSLYISASTYDWSTYGGVSVAAARSMGRQWFRTSVTQFRSAPYAFLFLRAGLVAALATSAGPTSTVTFATLRGRPVLALHLKSGHVLYVSAAGSPRPVQLSTAARSFGFSYAGGAVITVPSSAPPAP
jgi:hypothetical protein